MNTKELLKSMTTEERINMIENILLEHVETKQIIENILRGSMINFINFPYQIGDLILFTTSKESIIGRVEKINVNNVVLKECDLHENYSSSSTLKDFEFASCHYKFSEVGPYSMIFTNDSVDSKLKFEYDYEQDEMYNGSIDVVKYQPIRTVYMASYKDHFSNGKPKKGLKIKTSIHKPKENKNLIEVKETKLHFR